MYEKKMECIVHIEIACKQYSHVCMLVCYIVIFLWLVRINWSSWDDTISDKHAFIKLDCIGIRLCNYMRKAT